MAAVSIGLGIVLLLQGVGSYLGAEQLGAERRSITALIPAFFGIAFVVLGVLARKETMRKHAMHMAAALGLIGFLIPGARVAMALSGGEIKSRVATASQTAMALLCLVFVVLCVRSFIMVRRSRAAGGFDKPAP